MEARSCETRNERAWNVDFLKKRERKKRRRERKNATFRYNGKQFLPSKPRLHMHTKPRFEQATMRGGRCHRFEKNKSGKDGYDAGTGYHTLTSIETSYGTAGHLCSRLEDRINSPSLPPFSCTLLQHTGYSFLAPRSLLRERTLTICKAK